MFSTDSSKICCSFAKNKIFENYKMAAKIHTYIHTYILLKHP